MGIRAYSDISDAEKKELLSQKRKYLTFSFDDSVYQDAEMIRMLNKYGVYGTFNINTGLLGRVMPIGEPGHVTTHCKIYPEMIKQGFYGKHEIAAHTVHHPYLPTSDDETVIREVNEDADTIENLSGTYPTGMAYPGGGQNHNEHVADLIRKNTKIKYARTINSNGEFKKPADFLMWHPTIWWLDGNLNSVADRFISEQPENDDMIFYIWGHAYEFDFADDSRERFEAFLQKMTKEEDIVFVTNRVLYKLFGQ